MEAFHVLSHRRQYRYVYNKFCHWFNGGTSISYLEGPACSPELWAPGQSQYEQLSKYQINSVLRHFMYVTDAPHFLLSYARRQWHLSAQEKESDHRVIDTNSALLTYQGVCCCCCFGALYWMVSVRTCLTRS